MKYYSEVTKKMYDIVKDLEKAEREIKDKNDECKTAAAAVEKAYDEFVDVCKKASDEVAAARKRYSKVLNDFCSKYGAYHQSIKSTDSDPSWKNLSYLLGLLNL